MTPPGSGWAPDTPDDRLVAAAQRGDRAALDALLRRHHDRILVLCRRLCRNRADADDAAQDALIAIVRGLARFDGNASFSTWSYRVATNACLDELRRRGRRPLPVDAADTDGPHAARPSHPLRSSAGIGPEQAALDTELRSELQRALDELPEEFRVPVVLRDVADLDYAEIAELLDLPPGTVRSRISRGRAKLALTLGMVAGGNQQDRADVRAEDAP